MALSMGTSANSEKRSLPCEVGCGGNVIGDHASPSNNKRSLFTYRNDKNDARRGLRVGGEGSGVGEEGV